MNLRSAWLLLCLFPPCGLYCQDILFTKEDLTFTLTSRSLWVRGTYSFCNPTGRPVEMLLYYPIGGSGPYDSAKVFSIGRNRKEKIVSPGVRGWHFRLHADAGDTSLYYIEYRQRLTGDSAVYLLQTTRRWGRPLDSGTYTLITDDRFPAVTCSYPPDTLYHVERSTIYRWHMRNFLPKKDMIFHFKIP